MKLLFVHTISKYVKTSTDFYIYNIKFIHHNSDQFNFLKHLTHSVGTKNFIFPIYPSQKAIHNMNSVYSNSKRRTKEMQKIDFYLPFITRILMPSFPCSAEIYLGFMWKSLIGTLTISVRKLVKKLYQKRKCDFKHQPTFSTILSEMVKFTIIFFLIYLQCSASNYRYW